MGGYKQKTPRMWGLMLEKGYKYFVNVNCIQTLSSYAKLYVIESPDRLIVVDSPSTVSV